MAIKNMHFKKFLSLVALVCLTPVIVFSADTDPGTWKSTNVHVYIHKDVATSSTTVKFRRDCTAGQKVGDATCPSAGYFVYSISKKNNATDTFPYVKYYRAISRETAIRDDNWKISAFELAGSHGTETINLSHNVSKVMTNTVVTFKADGSTSGTTPAENPPDDPYDDPAPTPDSDGGDTTKSPEPAKVTIEETVKLDQEIAKTKGCGSNGKYTSGILKGVSCTGATKTKEELIQIVKNIIEGVLVPSAGVIFVTVLVVGGLVYITSGGNEESIKKAKKILTSGIVGLLLVTLSYTLIRIFVTLLGGAIV